MQDHPGLRGTPLAMMAALCNKTASMSPPPLADAAVGKGFHPWKKSGGSNSPEATGSGGRSSQPVTTSPAAAAFSPPPHQATSPSPSYGKSPLTTHYSPLITHHPALITKPSQAFILKPCKKLSVGIKYFSVELVVKITRQTNANHRGAKFQSDGTQFPAF